MKFQNILISLLILFSLISCTEKKEKISIIKEDNLEMQMIEAYNEGLKEFDKGDVFFAAKKFQNMYNLQSLLLLQYLGVHTQMRV